MLKATLAQRPSKPFFDAFRREAAQTLEGAALRGTDRAAHIGKRRISAAMAGAGLGKLGQAIGTSSDLKQGRGVRRTGADGFSASGMVNVRSRSARTRGAIEAYSQGAEIRPRRGRWLWISTPDAMRFVGSRSNRERLTPESYVRRGLAAKLGPLVPLKGINGAPMLAVRNVGTSATGHKRGVRPLKKKGAPSKHDRKRELVILFIAIPRTSRAGRFDPSQIIRDVLQNDLPAILQAELSGARR